MVRMKKITCEKESKDTVVGHETREVELILTNLICIYSSLPKRCGKGRQVDEGGAAELCHGAERVRLGPR